MSRRPAQKLLYQGAYKLCGWVAQGYIPNWGLHNIKPCYHKTIGRAVVEAKGLKDNVWPKNWPKDATSTIYLELVQQTWVGGGRSGIDRQIFSQNNSETDVFVSVKQISLATWVVLSQFLLKLVQILIRIQLPDIWLGQRYKCYTQSLSDFGRNFIQEKLSL